MNPEETQAIERSSTNTRKLEAVIDQLDEETKEILGPIHIETLGESGFIIQRENHKPMAGNDWVLYDYDDTLAATTGSKTPRLQAFTEYAQGVDTRLQPEQCQQLMAMTDKFCRWEEIDGAGKNYHAYDHVAVLDWAMQEYRRLIEGMDPNVAVSKIQERLDAMRTNPQQGDPFYINKSDRRLHSGIRTRNTQLDEIFAASVGDPMLYQETIDSMREQAAPKDSIHRTNVGILSYGEPHYQLRKIIQMLKDNPDLPISQIMLTNIKKGEFFRQAIEAGIEDRFDVDYTPAHLDEQGGFTSIGAEGKLFGNHMHTVIMIDDDPDQLDNIVDIANSQKDRTGARVVTVRSVRPGTKAERKESKTIRSQYGTIDFTSLDGDIPSISNVLLINRYLEVLNAIKEGLFDANYWYVQALRQELKRRDIQLS